MTDKVYNFSYSKIATYLECPKRYELQVIRDLAPFKENIYTSFGSAIHKAIQLSIEKNYNIEESIVIFEKELKEHIKRMDPRESQLIFINEWINKAKPLLQYYFDNFYDKIKNKEIEVLGVEKYFTFEIQPGIFYNGIIDLLIKENIVVENTIKVPDIKILKNGNKKKITKNIINKDSKIVYKILDWKTGALKSKEDLQLLSYTIPLLYLENILIDNVSYVYLKYSKSTNISVNEIKINDTKNKIISIINNIIKDTESNNFNMCLDSKKCKYCNVKKFCDKDFESLLESNSDLNN